MERGELIRRLVLNSICDDYENVDQCILQEVASLGTKCGLTITRSQVVSTLAELVDDGLAKAYLLSTKTPFETELPGMPPLGTVEEDFRTYFLITDKGRALHLSDDSWWPLDADQGSAR